MLIFRVCLLLTLAGALSSCFDDGSGGVSLGNSATNGNTGSVRIGILKIQNLISSAWVMDSSGKVYVKSPTVSINGTCTRGVYAVSATVNSVAVSEKANCDMDGTFSWSKTFSSSTPPTGTVLAINFQAMTSAGEQIAGVSIEKTLVLDLNAPAAPVLDSVAGCTLVTGNWLCNSPNVRVTGSWLVTEDVVSVQAPSSGTLTNTSTNTFQFDLTLSEGQSRNLDFTVTDRAGNISGLSTITVTFAPTTDALASSVNSGGTSGFAGGPINTAPSLIANVGTMSGVSADLNSASPVSQRAQLQIGPVAVGAKKLNP